MIQNWRKAGQNIGKHSKSQSRQEVFADAAVPSKISSRIDHQLMQITEL